MSLKNKITTKVSLSDLPDLLTIREVADLLRISPLTIKRWVKKENYRLSELTREVTVVIVKKWFRDCLEWKRKSNFK